MAGSFIYVTEVVASGLRGQDRVGVSDQGEELVIALADGAGGTGRGAEAAQAVVDAVLAAREAPGGWREALEALDRDAMRLRGGQATAVVVRVTGAGIDGASVGDSGAWVIRGGTVEDLTAAQLRKPLVGGGCVVVEFAAKALGGGTLLLASDGLLKYAKASEIVSAVEGRALEEAAAALLALARLPSGGLQDDVSLVLCREHA